MKVLQIYNQYRSLHGGEENVVMMIDELLSSFGHETQLLMRSSRGLDQSAWGKVKAFAGAFYNRSAFREVAAVLESNRPDVVHVHNLYPLYSPSVLVACQRAGVPVVMTTHNYVLTCPVTSHLRQGAVCERCLGGKEYQCVVNNCRGNRLESAAYAMRSAYARRHRLFHDNVNLFITLTEFGKSQLVRGGFSADKIEVLPNMVKLDAQTSKPGEGEYVAYCGRLGHEKGIDTLLEAMRHLPNIPLKLAGHGPLMEQLRELAPPNCEFVGMLNAEQVEKFYEKSRMVVVPSRCFEGCPLVISEAMSHSRPLIVSQIGGLPELVRNPQCGHVFKQGDTMELSARISELWADPEECRRLGENGRIKAEQEYSRESYYENLMGIYQKVICRGSELDSISDCVQQPVGSF